MQTHGKSRQHVYRLGGTLGGTGVSVRSPVMCPYRFSMSARTSASDAPEAHIVLARSATAIHIAHAMPCSFQAVTVPSFDRLFTKQSSLDRCAISLHPQKQGT